MMYRSDKIFYHFRGSPSFDLEFDLEGHVICQNGYHIRDPGGPFYQRCTFWRAALKVAEVVANFTPFLTAILPMKVTAKEEKNVIFLFPVVYLTIYNTSDPIKKKSLKSSLASTPTSRLSLTAILPQKATA